MKRLVEPEWLDELPPQNPGAVRSRRDLSRINRLMGHAPIFISLLRLIEAERWVKRLVDLGGGDGTFLLRLFHRLPLHGRPIEILIVDRQDFVHAKTQAGFKSLEVQLKVVTADVLEWLAEPAREVSGTLIFANLFLHHFGEADLQQLLDLASARCAAFVACEPRRSAPGLIASRLLGLIGCDAITRHDALVSVRGGFTDRELSALWPADRGWSLKEGRAGIFSHSFVARRARTIERC